MTNTKLDRINELARLAKERELTPEELAEMSARAKVAIEAIKAFCLSGVTFAMNNYNNK